MAHTYSNGSAHLLSRHTESRGRKTSSQVNYPVLPYFTRVRATIGILFGMKMNNLCVPLNFKMGYTKVHPSPQREQEIVYYRAKVIVALEHKFRFSQIPSSNVIPVP